MRNVIAAAALGVLVGACGGTNGAPADEATGALAVNALWPQPMPNHWILGSVTGVAVDAQDRVWVAHRGQASLNPRTESTLEVDPPGAETCCAAAPAILAFDTSGALVSSWGGPGDGYAWPQTPGGIDVDADGNVWITAAAAPAPAGGRAGRGGGGRGGRGGGGRGGGGNAPPPPADAHVLKFSGNGQFLMQIGTPGMVGDAASETGLNHPADVAVDSAAGEVYVADTGNRRVVVFDAATGGYKRHWGAYGEAPDAAVALADYDPMSPPVRQFRQLSCVTLGPDGRVYVCDRTSNRIQVFEKDGTFVKEVVVSSDTLGDGAAWDIAFADDEAYVADGQDHHVIVLDADSLEPTGTIGTGGRWPGAFYAVGHIATDSAGRVYTGEALEGKRVQQFRRGQ